MVRRSPHPVRILARVSLALALAVLPVAALAAERISDTPRPKRISSDQAPVSAPVAAPPVLETPPAEPFGGEGPVAAPPTFEPPAQEPAGRNAPPAAVSLDSVSAGAPPDGKGRRFHGVPLRDQNEPENGDIGPNACGPTALAMAIEYFWRKVPTPEIIRQTNVSRENGATVKSLSDVANRYLARSHFCWGIAFGRDPVEYLLSNLEQGGLVIVPIVGEYGDGKIASPDGHYLLVTGVRDGTVYANDPAGGVSIEIPLDRFRELWKKTDDGKQPCVVVKRR